MEYISKLYFWFLCKQNKETCVRCDLCQNKEQSGKKKGHMVKHHTTSNIFLNVIYNKKKIFLGEKVKLNHHTNYHIKPMIFQV